MLSRLALSLVPALFLAFLSVSFPVAADDPLPAPSGEVILKISGDVAHANVGDEVHFDREMLMDLSPRTLETRTPWHRRAGRFEGPLVRTVLEAAGARGDRVRVHALNDFEAQVPVEDFHEYDVLLAMRHNGQPMAIRDFGPLFVLYPFDQHPELNNETIRFRSVWQVGRIHVESRKDQD